MGKYSKNCCEGESLPSNSNEIEILIRQLKREVKALMQSTETRLLCQNKKIDETMVYIKNNLSNAIRELIDSMIQSGEIDEVIKSTIEEAIIVIETNVDELRTIVNKNTSDIELIGTNLTTINNSINNLLTEVNKLKVKQDKLVVFGDSWSDLAVPSAIWSPTLASELNLTNINYAKDGAGFVQPSNNLISSQIVKFIGSDIVKETVKYIVVLGGINDYNNGVPAFTLYEEIKSCLDTLHEACPQAKILYVSNCKYPYTKNQLAYWYQVHNAVLKYNSLNLINKVGLPLMNESLFHLTEVGQIWLAKNINACLTGGELLTYLDTRTFEDSNVKVEYSTIPLSNNSVMVSIALYLKQSLSEGYTLNISDTGISYGGETGLFGSLGTSFNNVVCDTTANSITFGFKEIAYVGAYYYLNQVLYTQTT